MDCLGAESGYYFTFYTGLNSLPSIAILSKHRPLLTAAPPSMSKYLEDGIFVLRSKFSVPCIGRLVRNCTTESSMALEVVETYYLCILKHFASFHMRC